MLLPCFQFKAKTGNDWDDRDNFVPKSKKYTMIEMADDDGEADDVDTVRCGLQAEGTLART